jgi:DNA-directed RNA polymerase subunit RPC12/RpoP
MSGEFEAYTPALDGPILWTLCSRCGKRVRLGGGEQPEREPQAFFRFKDKPYTYKCWPCAVLTTEEENNVQ